MVQRREMGQSFLDYYIAALDCAMAGALERALLTPEQRATSFIEFDTIGLTRANLTARTESYSKAVGGPWMRPTKHAPWRTDHRSRWRHSKRADWARPTTTLNRRTLLRHDNNKETGNCFELDIKTIADDGSFTGYASLFGVTDLGGDVCTGRCVYEDPQEQAASESQNASRSRHVGTNRRLDPYRGRCTRLESYRQVDSETVKGRETYELLKAGA